MLAKLPENPGPEVLAEIRALDQRLEGKTGEPIARLRVGIVAVLGRSGEAESLAYLRNLYYQRSTAPRAGGDEPHATSGRRELADPGRFAADGGRRAGAGRFSRRWRQSIGSRKRRSRTATRSCSACDCKPNGGELVAQVARKMARPDAVPGRTRRWPNNWRRGKLVRHDVPQRAAGRAAQGIAAEQVELRGAAELTWKARGQGGQSVARRKGVHRCASASAAIASTATAKIGPDLTTVAQRFQRKEILESIVYPNQVVSDQYASQIVIASGKTYTGIAAKKPTAA